MTQRICIKIFSLLAVVRVYSVVALCLITQQSYAQPALNFQPLDPTFGDHALADTRCNRPEGANVGCGGMYSRIDSTPFLQELYRDPVTGENYYHVIVGRPEDGFAQEVLIKATGPTWEGGLGSASLGDGNCRSGFNGFSLSECNISDPLGVTQDNIFTGNGSGDPRTVRMRQVMGGTWDATAKTWNCLSTDPYCLQFLKDSFANKPVIEQHVFDAASGMVGTFKFDMSNSNYSTNTIAGSFLNTVVFSDPELSTLAGFNYAIDANASASVLTGGKYIFTGTGPTNAVNEPYLYWDGSFQLDQEWAVFKN